LAATGAVAGAGAGARGCDCTTGCAENIRVYSPGPAEGAGAAGGVNSGRV
jgi:hypothetical protein